MSNYHLASNYEAARINDVEYYVTSSSGVHTLTVGAETDYT